LSKIQLRRLDTDRAYTYLKASKERQCDEGHVIAVGETYLAIYSKLSEELSWSRSKTLCSKHGGKPCELCGKPTLKPRGRFCSDGCMEESFRRESVDADERTFSGPVEEFEA
jgi:hypothetical protein